MTQQTLTRLRHLKLTGMADAVQQQLEQASTYEGLPFIEQLSLLVEHEQLSREQRKQARLVKQARLKLQATVQRWTTSLHATWSGHRWQTWPKESGCAGARTCSLPAPVAAEKPPSLCAGLPSLSAGHSTRYYRLPRLLLELSQAKVDGSYARLLGQLAG